MEKDKRTPIIKVLVFVGIVVLAIALNAVFGFSAWFEGDGAIEALHRLVDENLLLALGAYLVATVVGSVVLALPGVVFAVAAGLCFGPVLGTLACSVAATAGAVVAFVVGRYFLRDAVRPQAMKSPLLAKWLFSESQANAVLLLAVTRLVPLFPYNLQNFAYGATDIRLSTYTVCSFLFMVPGCALYTVATAGVVDEQHRVVCFAVAAVLLAASTAVAYVLRRRYVKEDDARAAR